MNPVLVDVLAVNGVCLLCGDCGEDIYSFHPMASPSLQDLIDAAENSEHRCGG